MGKEAKNLEEQIQILPDRGMILDCEESKIKEYLLDIGYYRLGFYWFPFEKRVDYQEDRKHCFLPNTKFSTIIDLYYLDVDLRHLMVKYLNRILQKLFEKNSKNPEIKKIIAEKINFQF